MLRAVATHLVQDGLQIQPIAAVEGILRVAILAAQRTTGQPHENRRITDRVGLPLQRMKNLVDAQALGFAGDFNQCSSVAILSRRCCAKCPAGASESCVATSDRVRLAKSHCFNSYWQ